MSVDRTENLHVRLAAEEMTLLCNLAAVTGLSISDVVRQLIRVNGKRRLRSAIFGG